MESSDNKNNLSAMHMPDGTPPKEEKFPIGIFIVSCIAVVLFAGLVGLYFFKDQINILVGDKGSAPVEEADQIVLLNETLNVAGSMAESGNYEEAQRKLEALYIDTYDPIVKEQTLLAMARNARSIDAITSAELYLKLVHDETIKPELRAGVIEEIGLTNLLGKVNDPGIFLDRIFADEPFASLSPELSQDSYARIVSLFEYGNSLSPQMTGTAFSAYYPLGILWATHKSETPFPLLVPEGSSLDEVIEVVEAKALQHLDSARLLIEATPDTSPLKSLATAYVESATLLRDAKAGGDIKTAEPFSNTRAALSLQREALLKLRSEAATQGALPPFDMDKFLNVSHVWNVMLQTTSGLKDELGTENVTSLMNEYLAYVATEEGASLKARLESREDNNLINLISKFVDVEPRLKTYIPETDVETEDAAISSTEDN